jgi:hypothetical protein
MSLLHWLKKRFHKKSNVTQTEKSLRHAPLREFAYLDEVSLRSLLSSQVGEVTDTTSQQVMEMEQAEFAGKIAAEAPLVGPKAEISSQYQTSNSSTLQTSRKATVQSWFRELHRIPHINLVKVRDEVSKFETLDAISKCDDTSIVVPSTKLNRGQLVELRVKLAADPVFHMGALVSEISGMFDEFPHMFNGGNGGANVKEAQVLGKIIQRLLAGLIPIRALAVDFVVVEIAGIEYAVHKAALGELEIAYKPLFVVGVTEHQAYWKDIRRVLFSDVEFTVLSRVSRSGLQVSWTPVKLAELFSQLTPDLTNQISTASLTLFAQGRNDKAEDVNERRLAHALKLYVNASLTAAGKSLSDEQEADLAQCASSVKARANSASGQRSAFSAVAKRLEELVGVQLEPIDDMSSRQSARDMSGLSYFPSLAPKETEDTPIAAGDQPEEPRLLDVEIVAIYW